MKINHLGVATRDIDEALKFWADALGLENVHTETVGDQKVRVAMLPLGESRIELLEPTSDDSPISKFLEKRGGGIHHIAVEVDDIEASLKHLKDTVILRRCPARISANPEITPGIVAVCGLFCYDCRFVSEARLPLAVEL
jgi:methylmalonyl-CoA epimerase